MLSITVAIVDAYDSPTLLQDAQEYYQINDPAHALKSSQFTNVEPATVGNEGICGGSGWFDEQSLDVEAVHAMAPGAHIEYVGANDCFDNNLLAGVDTAVATANVVTDSWGDTLGDIFEGGSAESRVRHRCSPGCARRRRQRPVLQRRQRRQLRRLRDRRP